MERTANTLPPNRNLRRGVAAGSLGLLIWCLRGGSLIASAISVLPVWTSFDTLRALDLAPMGARANHARIPETENDPADDDLEDVFQ